MQFKSDDNSAFYISVILDSGVWFFLRHRTIPIFLFTSIL